MAKKTGLELILKEENKKERCVQAIDYIASVFCMNYVSMRISWNFSRAKI